MLYIGEELGTGDGPEVDVAVDPLEGTNIVAAGGWNALAVLPLRTKEIFYMHLICIWIKLQLVLKQSAKSISMLPLQTISCCCKSEK